MSVSSGPCEPNNPLLPGEIPRYRTSGTPQYRCITLPSKVAVPQLKPCTSPMIGKGGNDCKCPPNLPVRWSSPQICVKTCPVGMINLQPDGRCGCPDTHEQIDRKCVPKCDSTQIRNSLGKCIPKPQPIVSSKPISIQTDIELGGFEQSIVKKQSDTRQNPRNVTIEINQSERKVSFGDFELYGDLLLDYTKYSSTGKAPKRYKVNGIGKLGNNTWPLYIKQIVPNSKGVFGFAKKAGVTIKFYAFDGEHAKVLPKSTPPIFPPPDIFIVTDGLVSYKESGKDIKTSPEQLAEALRLTLTPSSSGGRRKTMKRNNRKPSGKYKKTRKYIP